MRQHETARDNTNTMSLHINGSLLAVGKRPRLAELDTALRGVALSDSPVLIHGSGDDRMYLMQRLHALSRRASLPVRECRSPDEAEHLFHAVLHEGDESAASGTWALHSVGAWPRELQMTLNEILEAFDESRLHGRLKHEFIPRIVVLEDDDADPDALDPTLHRRLSFFHLSTCPAAKEDKRP